MFEAEALIRSVNNYADVKVILRGDNKAQALKRVKNYAAYQDRVPAHLASCIDFKLKVDTIKITRDE